MFTDKGKILKVVLGDNTLDPGVLIAVLRLLGVFHDFLYGDTLLTLWSVVFFIHGSNPRSTYAYQKSLAV